MRSWIDDKRHGHTAPVSFELYVRTTGLFGTGWLHGAVCYSALISRNMNKPRWKRAPGPSKMGINQNGKVRMGNLRILEINGVQSHFSLWKVLLSVARCLHKFLLPQVEHQYTGKPWPFALLAAQHYRPALFTHIPMKALPESRYMTFGDKYCWSFLITGSWFRN